jgi:sigma-B regulation protein RsbU (phosphoserine phosphatase)
MKTAKEVGGDFYDFFEIEGTKKIGFIMADVSGKGIPAALFMMASKTQLRNHMQAGLAVDEAVNAANHQLCLGNDAGMFVTALICTLDYETGHIEYVNAGHNPPLVYHDGSWEWKKDVSGMPLGLFDGIPYEKLELDFAKEDTIYLYTDGVTEAMSVENELFGEERLEQTLCQYAGMNPRSISVGVRRAITDFTHDAEQSDDITMLSLKYGVAPEEKAVMILDARRDQLVHVVNYIHAELYRRHAPKSVYGPLDLACEELFTNVCLYAYPEATEENPGIVRIQFDYSPAPPTLTVQISDDGVPYNPLEKEDPATVDSYDSIMDIPIGGLGIMLAKKSVEDMSYERANGTSNVLTFKKSW